MDIRSAQQAVWESKLAERFAGDDIPLRFSLVNAEIFTAFSSWRAGRSNFTDSLASAAILLLGLAGMTGADLQDAIEERLLGDESGFSRSSTHKGKLVRDKIPQIIQARGGKPIIRISDMAEYRELLRAKLIEEVNEVLAADDKDAPEELADVFEVVLALASDHGLDADQLEKLRMVKAEERGGFTERIVWSGNVAP